MNSPPETSSSQEQTAGEKQVDAISMDNLQVVEASSSLTEMNSSMLSPRTKMEEPAVHHDPKTPGPALTRVSSASPSAASHAREPISANVGTITPQKSDANRNPVTTPASKQALPPRLSTPETSIQPPSPKPSFPMTTIDNSSPGGSIRGRMDSDDLMNIPPAHPFFQQGGYQYDSDGSNGSFVQKRQSSGTDSVNTTGSVKYVPPSSTPTTPSTRLQQVQQPPKPHMLPYHERQKLKKLNQKQQGQVPTSPAGNAAGSHPPDDMAAAAAASDFSSSSSPYQAAPHTGDSPFQHGVMPGMMPPTFAGMDPAQVASYMNLYGIPPPPPPPMGYYGYPSMPAGPYPYPTQPGYPPNPHSSQPPAPYGAYPSAPGGRYPMPPPPPPQGQPPPGMYPYLPPPGATNPAVAAPMQPRLSPYRAVGKQAPPPPPKPPKTNKPPSTVITNVGNVPRPDPRPFGQYPTSSAESSTTTNSQPPSPPPPLHKKQQLQREEKLPTLQVPVENAPPLPLHVMSDSMGSVSSLEGGGGSGPPTLPPNDKKSGKDSFLKRLGNALPSVVKPSSHRRRLSSHERVAASRGTHQRLPSINNDNWEETPVPVEELAAFSSDTGPGDNANDEAAQQAHFRHLYYTGERNEEKPPNEQTSLLPPTGISSNEQDGISRLPGMQTADNQATAGMAEDPNMRRLDRTKSHKKNRKKKAKRKYKRRHHANELDTDSSDSATDYDYQQWNDKRTMLFDQERARLMAHWKAEADEEAFHRSQRQRRRNVDFERWRHHVGRHLRKCTVGVESFVANLPAAIGAVAMSIVTLGAVWFKFAEENMDTCEPVHFHSSQCTFPEFPGCFYCDTNAPLYVAALKFHYGCKIFAGALTSLFILKILFATRVVLDEISSPVTASPVGLLCMTTASVFAGRGSIGQGMVTCAGCVHICIVLWFVYMALAYRIMPDPSWYPNTVGIGLSAVKLWLYYPKAGLLLMAISLVSNFFFYPISLFRVLVNDKISATVGWMQMSAPSISLYALTIMAQPSFEEEHPDVTRFQRVHRRIYLPCMHAMAALSVLGFLASCHSLWKRWPEFYKRNFSPAHAAFCFPLLSHANALQAYRGAIISFSVIHPRTWPMLVLFVYWFGVLLAGTIATLFITIRFLYCLPRWTNIDVSIEEEPPAPNETMIALQNMVAFGDTMCQPYTSPAILQANETGALILARRGSPEESELQYIRSRRIAALGFEPTMVWDEMQKERNVLLEYAAKHPVRQQCRRTLSVPGIDFSYERNGFGVPPSGGYGTISWSDHERETDEPVVIASRDIFY